MAFESNLRSIVHFMAYPGPGLGGSVARGEAPEGYLLHTVGRILADPYFGCIEITMVKSTPVRRKLAEAIRSSGKRAVYCCQPVQFRNEDGVISPQDISSTDEPDRLRAVARIRECVDEALELGATGISLVSGADCGTGSGSRARVLATAALARSLDEVCTYASTVAEPDFTVTLETFDRSPEPGHKNQLIGPSPEAADLARVVRHQYGHARFGLLYDLSHMPLIRGLSFEAEGPAALSQLAPYLNHIHIGNCVTVKGDPLYGDSHPGFGYASGAVNAELTAEFLMELKEIDYRGPIGYEVAPHGQELSDALVASTRAWFDEAAGRIDVNYALGSFFFQPRKFMPEYVMDMINEVRVASPEVMKEEAGRRARRTSLTGDGRLMLLAADHPGRNVTKSGDDPIAMGDRLEYLARIVRVVSDPAIDGLMATPDIIDDLFILSHLLRARGGRAFLDGKVLVGCMNRGGLAGAAFEMDDRMTAYTAKSMVAAGLDGAKVLFRYEPESRFSIQTMKYCSDAINECNALGLPMFLEPLPVHKDGSYKVTMTTEDMVKMVGIASAMGNSSAGLWIKIPYVERYHEVARATTLPILMLGGESAGDPTGVIQDFERGMASGGNVRGALVGRNVLFPGADDPLAVALAINGVVHEGLSTADAVGRLSRARGADMDLLTNLL